MFGRVENGLGQLNPSLIYHQQKPLETIITVSFNTHEDIKTKLNGLLTCSLTHSLTACVSFCLWSLFYSPHLWLIYKTIFYELISK